MPWVSHLDLKIGKSPVERRIVPLVIELLMLGQEVLDGLPSMRNGKRNGVFHFFQWIDLSGEGLQLRDRDADRRSDGCHRNDTRCRLCLGF